LVGVSNLTTKNQTGSQKKWTRKKALLREDESLARSCVESPVRTNYEGSAVRVGK
jgi:hypothetical protein